ncbi:MAG TPA: hypothetical protein VFO03_09415 [Gaiellaceae bacterium]|nr:hypothetical protein [Gaiellaceae bacterium]
MTASAPPERMCLLAARAGRVEVCTEDCPLWEHGACQLEAVLDPAADVDLDEEPEAETEPL